MKILEGFMFDNDMRTTKIILYKTVLGHLCSYNDAHTVLNSSNSKIEFRDKYLIFQIEAFGHMVL